MNNYKLLDGFAVNTYSFSYRQLSRYCAVLFLGFTALNQVHATDQELCADLEKATVPEPTPEKPGYGFVLSNDKQKIALYHYLPEEKLGVIKLWDRNTGKLLKSTKITNYLERTYLGKAKFSPDDSIVYLLGMTKGIPFWHLDDNKVVTSPCETAMGVTEVQFSTDMTVAYSQTNDGFHSLCRIDKAEQLAVLPYDHGKYTFDKQAKHLYANTVTIEEDDYQNKLKNLGEKGSQYISVYKSPVTGFSYKDRAQSFFASAFIDNTANRDLVIAKGHGDNLTVSLWQYQEGNTTPKLIHKQTTDIPNLELENDNYPHQELKFTGDSSRAVIFDAPDDFVFIGGVTTIGKQIGNAVSPLLARCLAEQILTVEQSQNKKSLQEHQ